MLEDDAIKLEDGLVGIVGGPVEPVEAELVGIAGGPVEPVEAEVVGVAGGPDELDELAELATSNVMDDASD